MATLYIIGNGFDLAHGLPTSFYDFAKFCFNECPTLFYQLDESLTNLDKWWSNFEHALGELNYSIIKRDLMKNLENKRGYPLGIDYSELSHRLRDWVVINNNYLYFKVLQNDIFPILPLRHDDFYLNFNYTLTLEMLYDIPFSQIKYIHGKVPQFNYKDKDQNTFLKLIYGHGLTSKEINTKFTKYKTKSFYFDYIETISGFSKELQINELKSWLIKLSEITHIIVLGHSMNDIDMPYFEILSSGYPNANWVIGFHPSRLNNSDYLNKIKQCRNLKFKNVSFLKF